MSDAPEDAKQARGGLDPRAIGTMPAMNARAVIDAALPFNRASQAPAPTSAPAIVAGAGLKLPRRPAPKQLASAGALIPLATFLAQAPAASPSVAPISDASGRAPDSLSPDQGRVDSAPHSPAPSGPGTPSSGNAGLAGSVSGGVSPWTQRSQPAALPPAGGEPSLGTTGDPSLAKSSPWLQSQSIAADMLPSAAVDIPSAKAPEPQPVQPPPAATGSRAGMTVLLALAAIALVGAIAYFAVTSRRKSDDPADVKAGQSQKDYNTESSPEPSASSAASAAPKPAIKAPPPTKPVTKKDIYDDL